MQTQKSPSVTTGNIKINYLNINHIPGKVKPIDRAKLSPPLGMLFPQLFLKLNQINRGA